MQPQPVPPTYTLAQLQALQAAYATGARVVRYADKEVTYNSPADLLQAIANVKAGLGIGQPRRRRSPGYFKGLF